MKFPLFKAFVLLLLVARATHAADPLPSWDDTAPRKAIVAFVEKVTREGSADFVPPAERVAVFDNDGTLWCEQPVPVQLYFALDRVKALAPQHPEWKEKEPFASLLKGDWKAALAGGDHAILELFMVTHTGMTTIEFENIVTGWISTARHPGTGRLFTEMTYQPMLELLAYLRNNGFKNFIVSGGGIEFMRPWAERVYGIPPEQVIGSSVKTKLESQRGKACARPPSRTQFQRRQGRQAGRHPRTHRAPARHGFRQFGGRQGDAGIHAEQRRRPLRASRPARRCRAGVRLRPGFRATGRQTGGVHACAPRAGEEGRLDRRQDERRLEAGLPGRAGEITAIDILLEPDAAMLRHAEDNNARLLAVDPKGFALDDAHRPHITMLQTFVRTADLDRVYEAAGKVLARAQVNTMKLEAYKYYYAPAGSQGIAGICARPSAQILALQADLLAAVKPFVVGTGPIGAFTAAHEDPANDAALIQYVSTFVPKMSGENFNPHVSTGVAPRDYLDKMLAEPFEPFPFSPARAAVYQLGPFGTAAKELKGWDLKP